jgi:hypothetical protein
VCVCLDDWDCDQALTRCTRPTPEPTPGGDWVCTWTEFKYSCRRPDGAGAPPGGAGWFCTLDADGARVCVSTPPNPGGGPEGTSVWRCEVQGPLLVCERGERIPVDPPLSWHCAGTAGSTVCTNTVGGLPPGGSEWKCSRQSQSGTLAWICWGRASSPPGGNGWTCDKVEGYADIWRCQRPDGPEDHPPIPGNWVCVKGSDYGGTVCEQVDDPSPVPSPGATCVAGQRMWCDSLVWSGWGQVECDPQTGRWKTIMTANGQQTLDCRFSTGGKRPNTVCACYHTYLNPSCCERPDCIVPPGTDGQLCPPSPGGLCHYCNPQDKGSCIEAGAVCIVTNSSETFCGRPCSESTPCLAGYSCMTVKLPTGSTQQCVPEDFSCYY